MMFSINSKKIQREYPKDIAKVGALRPHSAAKHDDEAVQAASERPDE